MHLSSKFASLYLYHYRAFVLNLHLLGGLEQWQDNGRLRTPSEFYLAISAPEINAMGEGDW